MVLLNEAMQDLFRIMNMKANVMYLNMLKHLNRRHTWKCPVPEYKDGKWQSKYTVMIREVPQGFINAKMEIMLGSKPGELGNKNYTIYFEVIDQTLNRPIKRGVCEDRKDFWGFYCQLLRDAYQLKVLQTGGIVTVAPEETPKPVTA